MKMQKQKKIRLILSLVLAIAAWAIFVRERVVLADDSAASVKLTLDWKPEPEFGGFYAAQVNGTFAKHQINAKLKSAGEGAPTWQLVATGKTEFATTAADQVLIARAHGADVVAIFAVYQTFPQGIMVHKARGFTKIDDVFHTAGTLAAEDDTWLQFCLKKFGKDGVKVTSYSGGIGRVSRQGRLLPAVLCHLRTNPGQIPGR